MPSFDAILIDVEKAKEGVWHDFTFRPGISLKIARLQSSGWNAALQKAVLLNPDKADEITNLQGEIVARVVCDKILLDWKNVEDKNGKKIKFTPDAAFKFVSDPRLDVLLQFIIVKAGNDDNFREEQEAQAVKN